MHYKRIGFTLAEVLITLLVIGVVASLVIPTIINDTQENEYHVRLKNLMASLSSAVNMLQSNNGEIVVGTGSTHNDHIALRNEFCNVMNCAIKDTPANIFGTTVYKYYKGGNFSSFGSTYNEGAALNNGTLLTFMSYDDCENAELNVCGSMYADINGQKGPNMLGKDLYIFHIARRNGTGSYYILPAGMQGDALFGPTTNNYCSIGKGSGCAALRLYYPERMK